MRLLDALEEFEEIRLRRTLFEQQREIYNCPAPFIIAICGRRWGKSRTAADWLIDHAVEFGHKRNPQDRWRWVVPFYKQAKVAEGEIAHELPQSLIQKRNKVDREWTLFNNAILDMRTGENPDSMLGQSHPRIVIEEAARIGESVWTETIRPALMDVAGHVMFITTPKGKTHWTYRLYLKGLDPEEPRYKSFHYPSWTSPRIDTEAIDLVAEDLGGRDSLAFKQEIGAEFLAEAASVFQGHRELAIARVREAETGLRYVGGVDIAKVRDYTVIRIKGPDHTTWYKERFTGADYNVIIERIAQVSQKYNNAEMFIDSTGVGDPVFDALIAKGVPVYGYKFTNESKQILVNGLVLAVARRETQFLEDDDALLGEMDVFEFNMTSSGRIRYEAPSGFHDDEVFAEALSEYGYQQRLVVGGIPIVFG